MSATNIESLLEIMRRLRDPDRGCPWDREQTLASLAPFTIEEAYEVADVIARGANSQLCDELGDLLFQVVFQAQVAAEQGLFDFAAVVAAIADKLVRRHPHVFGAVNALTTAQQTLAWEAHKAAERREIDAAASHIDGVPLAMPALLRAAKISKRAARVGFDWHAAEQTADKVAEELGEVREAMRARGEAQSAQKIAEEIGDLLFATANLARKLGLDPESALRAANAKFDKRFRAMERLAAERGQRFEELDLVAQESLWEAVKQAES